MPLDTSTYSLALLRLDGRRWNELRHFHAQISTQASASGSSYLEQGNTKIICTVSGPEEPVRRGGAGEHSSQAQINVEINIAGFSGTDRKKRTRNDRRTAEMQHTIQRAFASTLFLGLYPHSAIYITLHVLSQDGSLLAACLNAATLALVDAGVPMADYVAACTAGSTASYGANDEAADPLLDLNSLEEQELPFLTVAVGRSDDVEGGGEDEEMGGVEGGEGRSDGVCVLMLETRVQLARVEVMLAVGLDGCRQVRKLLDQVVRRHGKEVLKKTI